MKLVDVIFERTQMSLPTEELGRKLRKAWIAWLDTPAAKQAWRRRSPDLKAIKYAEWRDAHLKDTYSSLTFKEVEAPAGPGDAFVMYPSPERLHFNDIGTEAAAAFDTVFPAIIRQAGWYSKDAKIDRQKRMKLVWLEMRHSPEVPVLPLTLYHVTFTEHVPRIMRLGLRPMLGRAVTARMHPPRIYLATSLLKAREIAKMLAINATAEDDVIASMMYGDELETPPVTIIAVDRRKLRHGTSFYEDPDYYSGGVYTETPIPPEALSPVDD